MPLIKELEPRLRAARELGIFGELALELARECRVLGEHFLGDRFGDVGFHVLLTLERSIEETPAEEGIRVARLEQLDEQPRPWLSDRNEQRAGGDGAAFGGPAALDVEY